MELSYLFPLILCALCNQLTMAVNDLDASTESPCVFEGHISSTSNWFGYLANLSVMHSGRMLFEFTYAADRCCISILFYTEQQLSYLSTRMNCWEREYLLRPEYDQIMQLTPKFSWSGRFSFCNYVFCICLCLYSHVVSVWRFVELNQGQSMMMLKWQSSQIRDASRLGQFWYCEIGWCMIWWV